ncbi:hypothetical protein [Sphingobium sp. WCS2017Hpa-17]|uniref:hypothetical protein n=1 Tax=Sphingobium sp. WCS2017Hpa-17 TaxID=3073638 RepID=UPI00288B8868|nr:hypothetical protein [Sphingobium sp. WCS2017Hpa-17]
MSYDLMVFEPSHAPKTRAEFMAWYDEQVRWAEPHGYDDPALTTDGLRAWYADMTQTFPNIHDPAVTDDDVENPRMTDYSIGNSVIYAAFRWSQADEAYHAVRQLALKHEIGFFDASGDEGEILDLTNVTPPASKSWWQKFFGR